MQRKARVAVVLALMLAVGAACSTETPAANGPGKASGDEVAVKITGLRFSPDELTVRKDQRVTFTVSNPTEVEHEFAVGDADAQRGHAQTMAGGHGDMGGMNMRDGDVEAVSLMPGDTKTMTYTFDKAGEVVFGCHVAGHYEAGMKGTVHVEG